MLGMKHKCAGCGKNLFGKDNANVWGVYAIVLATPDDVYTTTLLELKEPLSNWIMERGYHLSASEVMLFRPDVFKEFLAEHFGIIFDEIAIFSLKIQHLCDDCFKIYKKLVPLV